MSLTKKKAKVTTHNMTKKNTYNKTHKFILVDGTSSAGKSVICKYFSTKNFECFQINNYTTDTTKELFKKIKNKYGEGDKIYDKDKVAKIMVDDAIATNKNIVFDHISQKEIISYMKTKKKYNQLYIINLFTNLNDLGRNIESRRKEGDRRPPLGVFKQFTDRYIKCNTNDTNKIEIVNRKKFKNLLLKYFKYYFKNKDELIESSNYIFKKMNIDDDDDHYIRLRDEYKYDYLMITTNKSKDEIFKELDHLFVNN